MAAEEQQLIVSIEGRINQLEKSMQRASKVTGDTYSGMEKRAREAAKNIDKSFSNDNMKGVAEGAKLSTVQFQILKAAATDAFGSLSAGQSAMTVLTQQAGQVASAIGEDGVMGLLGGIGNGLKGLVTPATAAMAAIAAVGVAGAYSLSRYRQEELAIELSLTGIGKLSGATAADIRRVGDEAAASGKTSAAAAREVAMALASTGRVKAGDLGDITRLLPGIERVFGVEGPKAAAMLAGIFSDPVKGADQLDDRLGMLDHKTRAYIITLVEQGNRQKAIRTLIEAVSPALEEAAQKTSVWARAWNTVANAADAASTAVGKAVAAPTLDEKLAATRARRDSARNGPEADYIAELKKAKLTDAQIKAIVPTYQPNTDALDAEVARLEAETEAQRKLNREKEEALRIRDASKAAGKLIEVFNGEAEAAEKLANQYTALKGILDDPAVVDKLDGGAEKAAATLQALRERVKLVGDDLKAGGSAVANALRAADFSKATAGLSSFQAGLARINREYEELIRNAKLSGDAATQAARVATLEAARDSSISAYRTESRDRALSQTAIPSDYYNSIRSAESSGNDSARSFTGAVGRYQFIESTWIRLFQKHKGELAATIAEKNPGDKGRAAILALRNDPEFQEELVKYLTQENAAALAEAGFSSSSRNLYGAHNIGSGGIIALLRAARDGQGGASAQSILDKIDPRLTSSNSAYYGGGKTVEQALAILERKATGTSAAGRAQTDATNRLRQEAEAYAKSAEEAEKLKSVEEALAADRQNGGELSKQFATANDLIKASSEKLTPELRAQREEILKLADARAKAAGEGIRSRFDEDTKRAREALGRGAGEQSDIDRVRSYGTDPTSARGKEMAEQLATLRTMQTLKSEGTSAISGLVTDLMRGTKAADAFKNALSRIAEKLVAMAVEGLVSKALGSFLGGGTGGGGGGFGMLAGIGKIFGFDQGGYTGDGGRLEPAGIVHRGEFVLPAHIVDKIGVPALERLRRGYSDGGLVGALPSIASGMQPVAGGMGGAPTITTPIHVTVQGSPGSNDREHGQIGENIAKAIENQMRSIVGDELRKSTRPGGIFDRR